MQELSLAITQFAFTKGNLSAFRNPGQKFIDVTGTHAQEDVGSVSTTDGTVSKGAVGTIGFVYIENTATSGNLLIGSDGTNYPLVLKPGEFAVFRFNAANVHVKSSTGTVNYYYIIVED